MQDLDFFHYHEALDRAFIACEQLDGLLGDHPVIQEYSQAKRLFDDASEKLGDLYQLLVNIRSDQLIEDKAAS